MAQRVERRAAVPGTRSNSAITEKGERDFEISNPSVLLVKATDAKGASGLPRVGYDLTLTLARSSGSLMRPVGALQPYATE